MNKKIEKLLDKAFEYREKQHKVCDDIYKEIIKIIDIYDYDDVHIFYQDGDGYCLCWNENNTPITSIVDKYIELNRVLIEEDLIYISI